MVERNLDDVEFGCKLQCEYIKEKLKKNGFGKMLYNDDDINKARQEGRVEGAINELESLHKLINNDLNYGHLLIRKQINDLIKKRLKSLESEKK